MDTITSFNYLRVVVSYDGSKPEILSTFAHATAALTKLKPVCKSHRVLVRYIIDLYCLAVQAGFYSDVVEC